jgi:hypothetical protein
MRSLQVLVNKVFRGFDALKVIFCMRKMFFEPTCFFEFICLLYLNKTYGENF